MSKNYYTTTELAEICHVSPTTIFRAVVNGILKAATTPGGHFRIAYEDAQEFLKKNNINFSPNGLVTKRILIVEDNPVELRMYQRAFANDPLFEIEATASGYTAGFLTQSFLPDLILLDIHLNDIDGREVAKLINSDPKLKHTKIVAITGSKNEKDLKDLKSFGFGGLIQKPISPADLKAKILNILK